MEEMDGFQVIDAAASAGAYMKPTNKLCRAKFFKRPKEYRDALGKIEYRDVEMIRIWIDSKNTLDEPVNEKHIANYYAQYRRFKDTGENRPDGTPLEMWPGVTPSQIENLHQRQLYTVEQVKEANDSDVMEFMGGVELKAKAKAYIDAMTKTSAAQNYAEVNVRLKDEQMRLDGELKQRDSALAKQQAEIEALRAKLDALSSVEAGVVEATESVAKLQDLPERRRK